MEVSGLFNSWATPATSWPIAASFSARASWRCKAVLSTVTARSPASSSILVSSSAFTRVTSRGSLRPMHPTCAPRIERSGTNTWFPFIQYAEGLKLVELGTWPYFSICSGRRITDLSPSLWPMVHASSRSSNFQTSLHLCSIRFFASPS